MITVLTILQEYCCAEMFGADYRVQREFVKKGKVCTQAHAGLFNVAAQFFAPVKNLDSTSLIGAIYMVCASLEQKLLGAEIAQKCNALLMSSDLSWMESLMLLCCNTSLIPSSLIKSNQMSE